MTDANRFVPDPRLDLVLERVVDVPLEMVWAALTQPEHVVKWITPEPWKTVGCEIDLRPGGMFNLTMRSPEGQDYPNLGCFLEIVANKKLVWTDALLPGFRPSPKPFFTAFITLEPQEGGTRYTAVAIHRDEEGRAQHEEMGFHQGWGKALDQMVAHMKTVRG